MSARLERERRSAKISKKVTFWTDVFSWEYCNFQIWEVLSLEPRAFLTFRFSEGSLEALQASFWSSFGCLWGCLGELVGTLGAPWRPFEVTLGPLWDILEFLGHHLGAFWYHLVAPKSAAQASHLRASGSLWGCPWEPLGCLWGALGAPW